MESQRTGTPAAVSFGRSLSALEHNHRSCSFDIVERMVHRWHLSALNMSEITQHRWYSQVQNFFARDAVTEHVHTLGTRLTSIRWVSATNHGGFTGHLESRFSYFSSVTLDGCRNDFSPPSSLSYLITFAFFDSA
jgi:hypothetical protein